MLRYLRSGRTLLRYNACLGETRPPFFSQYQYRCSEKKGDLPSKGEDFWIDAVGASGTPDPNTTPPPSSEEKKKEEKQEQLESRVNDMLETMVKDMKKAGTKISEADFLSMGKAKSGEKKLSLFEYAETLQGEEKEEFTSWLQKKTESAESSRKETTPVSDHDSDSTASTDQDQMDLREFMSSDSGSDQEIKMGDTDSDQAVEPGDSIIDDNIIDDPINEPEFDSDEYMPNNTSQEETKKKKTRKRQKKEEPRGPVTAEEVEEWEKEQDERAEKIKQRRFLRSKRAPFSLGSVVLPQGLRDRIQNLIIKYYKKRKFMRPVIHAAKPELTEKEKEYLDNTPSNRERARTPSRAENQKMIRQALHAHVFGDPVDAKQMAEKGTFPQIIFGKAESLAYVENFMTGQYGMIHRIFHEIETKFPNFTPRMILDFGAGPGTTLFAADEIWGENIIKHYLAVEPSSAMLDIAQTLNKFDTRAMYRRYLSMGKEAADYDIVVSSCSFTYLQTARERRDTIRSLWRSVRPGGMLVFAEVGSPVGFQMVRYIRELLIGEDVPATIVAPCPHQFQCPMPETTWCHLKQRTFLLPHERKPNRLAHRDIPVSWIVAKKPDVLGVVDPELTKILGKDNDDDDDDDNDNDEKIDEQTDWSRIVRQPRKRGGHVLMDLCTPQGKLKNIVVTKKYGKEYFVSARKAKWMDGFIDPTKDVVSEPEDVAAEEEPEINVTEPDLEAEIERWKAENPQGSFGGDSE